MHNLFSVCVRDREREGRRIERRKGEGERGLAWSYGKTIHHMNTFAKATSEYTLDCTCLQEQNTVE